MIEILGIKGYTIKEVADLLHITTRTTQQYITDKRLPAVKIGGRWLITEENIKSYVNATSNFKSNI